MASRFPVTVNISNNRLEELPSGTDLNLTGCGIYDGTSLGSNDQVLTSTGSGLTWKSVSNIGIVESDPVFQASPSSGITTTNITNWNTAYGWGNHAGAGYATEAWVNGRGYLTSYTETDTLDSVTDRGATTTNNVTFGNIDSPQGTIKAGNNIGGYFTGSTISADGRLTVINRIAGGNLIFAGYYFNSIQNTFVVDSNANVTTSGSLTAGGLTYPTTNGTSGQVLTSDGAGNVTWSAASGGATVSTSDTAPASPADGDLWWKSDEGRLKVYYQDANSDQRVDASPPLATNTVGSGGNSVVATANASASGNSLEFSTHNGTASAVRWRILGSGSLIPSVNDAYDIGSAEYKVRDFYLSDSSMHTESGKALQFHGGNLTWGGDDVIMLQDLKEMITEATSFEEFKNAILGL